MGLFDFFKRSVNLDERNDEVFRQVFGVASQYVTIDDALSIPLVNACISRISDIVASTDVRLYKRVKNGIKLVEDDYRVKMINSKIDGGRLNSFEFKKLLVNEYFLKGNSYFYIRRKGNKIRDLVYLPEVTISQNHDPLNKVFKFQVQGRKIRDYDLFRIARNTKNGVRGRAITDEAGLHFAIILRTMDRLLKDVNRGFLPKGFFKLEKNIRDIEALKKTVSKLMRDEDSGYIIMNEGLTFESFDKNKDSEKDAKAITAEVNRIASIFGVPVSILNGSSNEEDKYNFINFTILPLLSVLESAMNRDLLLETEQDEYFFAFETKELLKGNLYDRFRAYEVAIRNNIMSMDEVRAVENLEPLDFGFYKMNIADAFYFKDKNLLVNVNSGVALDMDNIEVTTQLGHNGANADKPIDNTFKPMNDFDDKEQKIGNKEGYLNKGKGQNKTPFEKGGEKDEDKSK